MTIKLLQWQTKGNILEIMSVDVSGIFINVKLQELLKLANDLNLACVQCNIRSIAWVETEG